VLAVGEIVSNTFLHTDAGGTVALWTAGNELVCQVQDSGYINDPLAGGGGGLPQARETGTGFGSCARSAIW
jgi:hypothetical protein